MRNDRITICYLHTIFIYTNTHTYTQHACPRRNGTHPRQHIPDGL